MKVSLTDLALDDLDQLAGLPGAGYDAIVFYHTLGTLTAAQEAGLAGYVAAGGGLHRGAQRGRLLPGLAGLPSHWWAATSSSTRRIALPGQLVPGHEITDGKTADFFVEDEMYVTSYDARVQVLATALWEGQDARGMVQAVGQRPGLLPGTRARPAGMQARAIHRPAPVRHQMGPPGQQRGHRASPPWPTDAE